MRFNQIKLHPVSVIIQ